MIEIIGHRGYAARAPENTLASLESAITAGADSVEWDVRLASCGTPVLFHDADLDRTTDGSGALDRCSFEQLRRLDAGRWFSPSFRGERIPSLGEALDAVRGRVSRVYCEIKAYREAEDLGRIVGAVRDAGMLGSVTFISLEWEAVERLAGEDPELRLGLVVDDPDRVTDAIARIVRMGSRAFLDADARLLLSHPGACESARDAGIEIGAWTVNAAGSAERLFERGVTRFTTDEVRALLAWRAGRAEG